MNKKAQGLSMNTIIIAALALIVLVVLTTIFVGRIGLWRQSTDECQNNAGICIDLEAGACEGQYERTVDYPCFKLDGGKKVVDDEKICCISVES